MWEPKMCRLALQLLGMLSNVLGRPRHALQRPWHALQRPRHALQRPWPTSTCFCKVLGVYGTWWYTTPLTSQLIRQQVGWGISLRCGTPRTLQKHVEVGRGRCKHA